MIPLLQMPMVKASKIAEITTNRPVRFKKVQAVAMAVFIAAAMLFVASCEQKPVMTHSTFKHLPVQGWQRKMPLCFIPEYDDYTTTYDVSLAVRHSNGYLFRNLSLAIDFIATDSVVERHVVDMTLADEYGNWRGGGFGTLYQKQMVIARDITAADAASIVVWQTMQGCDTLKGIVDLGIVVAPK